MSPEPEDKIQWYLREGRGVCFFSAHNINPKLIQSFNKVYEDLYIPLRVFIDEREAAQMRSLRIHFEKYELQR
jgi:hypothetical protein